MKVHGIAVRDRKTNELVSFIKCETGRNALRVLGGVRMNMSNNFKANEECVTNEEIKNIKQ